MVSQIPTVVNMGFSNYQPGRASHDSTVGVVDIQLGDLLTVLQTSTGEIFTMGDNISGQLGIGKEIPFSNIPRKVKIDKPVSNITWGWNHVFVYSRDWGNVYAWGNNSKNQIMPKSTDKSYYTPIEVPQITLSISSRIKWNARGTIWISKSKINFEVKDNSHANETVKKLEAHLFSEKMEKESYKKTSASLSTENNQLKKELMQMKIALTKVEKTQMKKQPQKNALIQTEEDPVPTSTDMMDIFKKKLKEDRTLRPCFEIDFKELRLEKKIGEGGFGLIYRGRWRETTVAVKVLKPDLMKEETIKDFLSNNEAYKKMNDTQWNLLDTLIL